MASVWKQTGFGSRQKMAKCWGIGERGEDKEKRFPSCGGRALQAHWPGCVLLLLLHLDLLWQTIPVISLGRAAGFTLVPFPSQYPELPQPRCFPRSCAPSAPALSCLHGSIPQAWNCLLLYLYSTRLAQALGHCCSESDYGEQPREAILARSAWESAAPSPGPSQGAAELLPSQP